jgi:hypothetical protein
MIMGSFARIATETVHDHEVTRAGCTDAGRYPRTLDAPALQEYFCNWRYSLSRGSYGVDAAFMLVEQRESGIHASCTSGGHAPIRVS